MARAKASWNQKERPREIRDLASALSANIWRLAGEGLLSLENEGFDTETRSQRLDVIAEFVAFQIHVIDRLSYQNMEEDTRQKFIIAIAVHITSVMQDNRVDANGPGDYRKTFVDLINQRMDDYSECPFSETDGPGFSLRRTFGERVRDVMGPTDNKWIPDYVMDIEAPKLIPTLKRVLKGMNPADISDQDKPPVAEGSVWGEG